MSQVNRLASGGRIDRSQPIRFRFNGQLLHGYAGDTVASALLANGVTLIGRSFKYHRPRGIIGSGAEEPNAIFQIDEGAHTVPNLRATQTELYADLTATSVNCWPSLGFDVGVMNGWFSRLLPAGFYYKTFMWPKSMWMTYEGVIRKAAGLGRAPSQPDPDRYERRHAHCDVLVVGAGPTGLVAAHAAALGGGRVILVDEQSEMGGSLMATTQRIDGKPAMDFAAMVLSELRGMKNVTLLPRTTAFGYHDANFVTLNERCTHHLPITARRGPRERVWRVRATEVVLATGAIERPLVFGNNDLPGVMLASAVSAYIHRYGVLAGQRAVIFGNNDAIYRTALDIIDAGGSVLAVVDSRRRAAGDWREQVAAVGVSIRQGCVVSRASGGKHIRSVEVYRLDGDRIGAPEDVIECDLLAITGGFSPVVHLHAQSGGRPVFDHDKFCFVPGKSIQAERSAGAACGEYDLGECLRQGIDAGREAAAASAYAALVDSENNLNIEVAESVGSRPEALWLVPDRVAAGHGPKQFVDYQNDTSAADIKLAAREGYRSIEHVKRYTALGFGTDQGKLGNINGMAILAAEFGQSIEATGTTTFRPNYTPITFGAIAARDVDPMLFDPVRKTAMHPWHESHGAKFENVGQWKRPWYYPKAGESMREAVDRECLATRNGVGILDASTLGKIEIEGPDAAAFLNLIYTNAWSKLAVGRCRYGLMLGEDGMVMDDGVTTRLGENRYYMTTTTGGAAHVLSWMEQWLQTEWPHMKVCFTSVTDQWAVMSVAGPSSRAVVEKVCSGIDFSAEAFPFMSMREGEAAGVPARVFRISFSGELAYEINVPANYGQAVWEAVMTAGEEFDITPYGTETMHVLRAEKGFIIVGQDTDGSVTPIDLGMDWIVSKNKDFLGRRSLSRSDCQRSDRKQLVGLLSKDGTSVLPEGAQLVNDPPAEPLVTPVPMVGHVTSSYHSASLGHPIALALVKGGLSRMGGTIHACTLGGRVIECEITQPLFYDTDGERMRQ
ncbi:MAG: sarcosine oxidase subunit alpha [marine bacterium B5-7]|nr:MAG: sarcosine oxidase subunit alpha [marine bacterium B5-7]